MYWLEFRPITYGFDSLFFYSDALIEDDIAEESHLILMKLALLDVSVQQVFPQLVQHPSNGLYVLFAFVLGVDKDVIEIHYYENVELLCQHLVDVTLKRGRCVGQSKKHDLIFEVTIASFEGRLLFVAFPDPYSIVGIGQIKLGETSSLT